MDQIRCAGISAKPHSKKGQIPKHVSPDHITVGYYFSKHDEHTLSSYYSNLTRKDLAPARGDYSLAMEMLYSLCAVARNIRAEDKKSNIPSLQDSISDSCRFINRIDLHLYEAVIETLALPARVCLAEALGTGDCMYSHQARDETDEDDDFQLPDGVALLFGKALGTHLLPNTRDCRSMEHRMGEPLAARHY